MNSKKIKAETITIRVTPEEKEEIKLIADQLDVTVSKLIYNFLFKEAKILEKAKNL